MRRPLFWPLAILGVGLGLRLLHLGRWSLDGDELYSFYDVQAILKGESWSAGARTAPLGYLAMALGVALLGVDEFALRLLPALAGAGTVAALLGLRRDTLPRGVAWSAGALAALSPWLLYHSQTARFYGPLLLFSTLATLWILPGVGRRPVAAGIAWGLAILCHPTALLLGAAFLAPLLAGVARTGRALVLAAVAAAVLASAVFLLDDGTIAGVVTRVLEGADPGRYGPLHLVAGLGYNLGPVVGLLALGGAFALARGQGESGRVLILGAALPVAVLLVAALGGLSMHQRYALCAVPSALLLAGWGGQAIARRGRMPAAAVALLTLASLAPALAGTLRDGNRHDARALAAWIAEHVSPEAILVAEEHATLERYLHAYPGFAGRLVEEAPPPEEKRFSFVRNRRDCWLALKASQLGTGADPEFADWVRRYFDEVVRIGVAPLPLVRHDNRYLVFQRRERVSSRRPDG